MKLYQVIESHGPFKLRLGNLITHNDQRYVSYSKNGTLITDKIVSEKDEEFTSDSTVNNTWFASKQKAIEPLKIKLKAAYDEIISQLDSL